MNLLLTGHGYLGTAVAAVFRGAGWTVTPVSLTGGDGVIACDLGNRDAVAKLPDADCVIHCAASGRGGPEAYRHVYLEGCRNLTERYPGIPFIFTSSTSVYAQIDGSWIDESSPAEPDRETGAILREAEAVTLAANGIVARLAGLYGPDRSVILRKFLAGESVIEGDGGRWINQIHRDDAARALLTLATSGKRGEIFNVADSTPLTQLDLHRQLAEVLHRQLPPFGPRDLNRKRGWTSKRISNAKLMQLGWQPRYPSFLDAIRGMDVSSMQQMG